MNPEEREKLEARKAELEARKAVLEAGLAGVKGRAAVVTQEMKQIQRMQFKHSVKNQLYDYKNEIARFRTTHNGNHHDTGSITQHHQTIRQQ